MARDTGGNVAVDYVWGNIPMQPDDDRGANPLNADLGYHVMATTSYNGFPAHTPVAPYLDTIANVVIPNVVGDSEADATTALTAAGLVKGTVTDADNDAGATAENDGTIKSQSPAAGTKVNTGSTVTLVKYAHTA